MFIRYLAENGEQAVGDMRQEFTGSFQLQLQMWELLAHVDVYEAGWTTESEDR